jgi:hypothetical protein
MEPSRTWEATQEISSILQNPKVHYSVHTSSPLVSILSQMNPVNTSYPIFKIISILSFHLRLGLPSGMVCWVFPPEPCPVLHAYPSHPPWLDHSVYIGREVQVMKHLVTQFAPASCYLISLGSKYSPRHPVLEHHLPLISDTNFHTHTYVAGMEYIVVSTYTGTLSWNLLLRQAFHCCRRSICTV